MKPVRVLKPVRSDHGAAAAALAAWPGDRPALVRLMECHIFHRAEWQWLGSREADDGGPSPIDAYRCARCERAWEKVG